MDLFDYAARSRFGGETFDDDLDGARLTGQMGAVWSLMRDGRWRTLNEIAAVTGAPEASVSARLRDLRKDRFGRLEVQRRRCGEGGTWRYRVILAK